jgi:hypothetical protein
MEDLIAETPADDVEGTSMEDLIAENTRRRRGGHRPYKDCGRVLGHDLLAEVKGLMPVTQQDL